MPEDTQKKEQPSTEDLLREAREDFSYCKSYWSENYEEAEKDMDTVLCIPPQEMQDDRKGRPLIWPDETSQYVNQTNNNFRENKRAVKISPRSEDARDEDAQARQAYFRGIEYASKAPAVYSSVFESMVECGFGFGRLTLVVTGPNGEQEPRIRRIPNWATVYPDPDAKEPDFSDSFIYFVTDAIREKTFARRYPNAVKKSFSGADKDMAPGWFFGEHVMVAEWWKRVLLPKADGEDRYKVTQRIMNGVEILETNEWIGSWIPILGCFGAEKYRRSGGQSKRVFMSLVRRARGPQQMLAYVASQEAEEFGMAPRAPLMGFEGTFKDADTTWKYAHKVPFAFLELKVPSDWNVNWGPPPVPVRPQFQPNIEVYQVAYEKWRRAVQAAMGITPLPTAAQRQNEKSGIALERIQTQEAIGSFHFTDNFARFLGNLGRQTNELITVLAKRRGLPKQLLGKDQKDEDVILKVVAQNQDPASEHLAESDYFFAHRGQFEVSVSDGMSYLSQREEASSFADTLLQTIPSLGLPPTLTQQVLAIAVKLKNIGTYGDEIHDLLVPPDPNNIPPQLRAIVAQKDGIIQQLMAEVKQLQLEKLGKVTEIQGKKELAVMEHVANMSEADKDRETKVLVAEITTKAQALNERLTVFADMMKEFHSTAHDLAMQLQQQRHEKSLAEQNALATSAQSTQDHAQGMEATAAQPEPAIGQ